MNRTVVVATIVAAIGCKSAENKMREGAAEDLIAQYEIAKRNTAAMDTCTLAGAVALSYLGAKNEAEYKKWKGVQAADCARAGVPVEGAAMATAPAPTAPASAEPIDIAIAGMTDWKAKMCACSDKACADKVHEGYKKWENDVVEPMMRGKKESDFPRDKMDRAEKLDDERKACRRNAGGGVTPTCAEAVTRSVEISRTDAEKAGVEAQTMDRLVGISIKRCAEDKWPPDVLKCMAGAKVANDLHACKLPKAQQDALNAEVMKSR